MSPAAFESPPTPNYMKQRGFSNTPNREKRKKTTIKSPRPNNECINPEKKINKETNRGAMAQGKKNRPTKAREKKIKQAESKRKAETLGRNRRVIA
jgi:hypothetical protein